MSAIPNLLPESSQAEIHPTEPLVIAAVRHDGRFPQGPEPDLSVEAKPAGVDSGRGSTNLACGHLNQTALGIRGTYWTDYPESPRASPQRQMLVI